MSSVMRMVGLATRVSSKAHRFAQRTIDAARYLPSTHAKSYFSSTAAGSSVQRQQQQRNQMGDRRDQRAAVLRAQEVDSLDSKLVQMDAHVRRSGRVTVATLEQAIEQGKQQGNVTSTQIAQLLRATGVFLRECSAQQRAAYTEIVWNLADPKQLDISHYNVLLQVYLENETPFDPQAFLVRLKDAGVTPNRVTYQRLVQRFCDLGDLAGASKVIEFMKAENVPVSERVFNALIKGHVLAGDVSSAHKVIEGMRTAGLKPSLETYTVFACSLAEKGDAAKALALVDEHLLSDEHILRLIKSFALKDDIESVKTAVGKLQRSIGFGQDVINSCFEILSHKKFEAARIIFDHLPFDTGRGSSGNYFIAQMVRSGLPLDDVTRFCADLKEKGLNDDGLSTAARSALRSADLKTSLEYIRLLHSQGYTVRTHFFYPIICKTTNEAEVYDAVREMTSMDLPLTEDIILDYILPRLNTQNFEEVSRRFIDAGCRVATAVSSLAKYLLKNGRVDDCVTLLDTDQCSLYSNVAFVAGETATPTNIRGCIEVLEKVIERQAQGQLAEKDLVGRFLQSVSEDTFKLAVARIAQDKQLRIGRTYYDRLLQRDECVQALHINMVEDDALAGSRKGRSFDKLQPLTIEELEDRLRESKDKNANIQGLASRLLIAYCRERNVAKVNEMLQNLDGEELSGAVLASLIDLNVYNGDLETALKYYRDVSQLDNVVIDDQKAVNLAALSAKEGRLAEAKDILSRHKFYEITDAIQRNTVRLIWAVAERHGVEEALKMIDEHVTRFSHITGAVLSPVMKVSLDKGDLNASLALFTEIAKKYKVTPCKRELVLLLIAAKNDDAINTVSSITADLYGKFPSDIDFASYYLESEQAGKAREILRDCPLNRVERKIEMLCEGFVERNQIDRLEQFTKLIGELGYNQDQLYYMLMRGYARDNNTDKALEQWTRAQEENIILSNRTLRYLARVLERDGREVPFIVPSEFEPPAVDRQQANTSSQFNNVLRHSVDEALKFRQNATLTSAEDSNLIGALTDDNQFTKAFEILKERLTNYKDGDMYPRPRTVCLLLSAMAKEGMIDDLLSLRPLLTEKLHRAFKFDDSLCNAYVSTGRIDECLDNIEKMPATEAIGYGWINKALDSHPDKLDRLVRSAKRLASEGGNYGMLNLLWGRLFSMGEYAKVEAIQAEFPGMFGQHIQIGRVLTQIRENKDDEMSARLVAALKNNQTKRTYPIALSAHIDVLLEKGRVEEAQQQLKSATDEGFNINLCNGRTLDTLRRELALLGKQAEFQTSQQNVKTYG